MTDRRRQKIPDEPIDTQVDNMELLLPPQAEGNIERPDSGPEENVEMDIPKDAPTDPERAG